MIKNLFNLSLIKSHQTILVALSGGPDSVCLLHQLKALQKEYNLTLLAAHLNHEWRGSKADQDQEFCKSLCQELNIPFFSARLSELKDLPAYNGSKENYARHARRKFLEDLAHVHKANAIALAHHQDDQLETFFIRLIRGCSLAGLIGMKPQQDLYIRPLLHCSKQHILEYLEKNNITFTLDASNDSDEFLRNRLRKHVIPTLIKTDARAEKNILELMKHVEQAEAYLHEHTQYIITQISTLQGYDTKAFLAYPLYMQYRMIMQLLIQHKIPITLRQSFLDECIRFLHNQKSISHKIHHSWALVKARHSFNFKKIL